MLKKDQPDAINMPAAAKTAPNIFNPLFFIVYTQPFLL